VSFRVAVGEGAAVESNVGVESDVGAESGTDVESDGCPFLDLRALCNEADFSGTITLILLPNSCICSYINPLSNKAGKFVQN
jgi:hypothetical protein